jgi:hypothetical protein
LSTLQEKLNQKYMILIYILSFIISCLLIFYLVKYATKSGVIESHKELQRNETNNLTSRQIELQKKYGNGEITFEQYKQEWDS